LVLMSNAVALPFAEKLKVTEAGERLERMFRDHHERVWRTLRRFGLAPEAAADATQQAYLIAAERIGDIRPGSERAFLIGTALRLGRGAYRSGRRLELSEAMDQRENPGSRADDLVEHQRRLTLAERVLSTLEPDLLEVFVLFELEGMTTPQIAELVGVPLGTAASRLRRAREAFREAASKIERVQRRPETR
jgi:RNA polymerase sigma-70 factor (ECF subfamily)